MLCLFFILLKMAWLLILIIFTILWKFNRIIIILIILYHIYHEGNSCAEWLANFGCKIDGIFEFGVTNLPSILRDLARLDKYGFPLNEDFLIFLVVVYFSMIHYLFYFVMLFWFLF